MSEAAESGSSSRSGTELFYGTLDILGLVLNVLCLLVLRKFTKLFHNELFILIWSLMVLSIFGCAMLVFKIFKTDSPTSFDYIGLASLAVPISYNLFLPAILSKGGCENRSEKNYIQKEAASFANAKHGKFEKWMKLKPSKLFLNVIVRKPERYSTENGLSLGF